MTTNIQAKIRPLADRVLVKKEKQEEKTTGGIILPDSAQQKQDMGKVIAVGPGKQDKEGSILEMPVKVGDKIMWDKYGGQELSVDDEEFIIVKASDIIAIITE